LALDVLQLALHEWDFDATGLFFLSGESGWTLRMQMDMPRGGSLQKLRH